MSVVWTLEPNGSPGSALTLAERGIADPGIVWPNQAPGVLSMTLKLAGGVVADLSTYAYDSVWVLRRNEEVFFRGRVRSVPIDSGNDSTGLQLVDAFGDLDDTPYLQPWDVVASDGSIDQQHIPRALISPSGSRLTSAAALPLVIAAAAEAGTTVGLSIVGLPTLLLPPIEASNLSCGELIRQILRYHPGATARISYGPSTDTLVIRDRSTAEESAFDVGARPVADFKLRRRDDQVVDSVHVMYETAATRFNEVAGEEEGDPATIRATRRLAVFKDVWPAGSSITRKSLAVVLPAPALAEPPQPPIPQRVPIKTRPLPPTGATDTEAEEFWRDLLGLSAYGIEAGDIKLPSSTADGVQPHRVRFAWTVDNPNDPMHAVPSPINPAATPVYRPDSVDDLPNVLQGGTIAEWMNEDSAELIVDATVAIRKATVDANPGALALVLSLNPRVGEVASIPAYLIYRPMRVTGTTASSRVYVNRTATGTSNPAADTLASIEAAREEAVVPDLAKTLYLERVSAPWEGSIPLMDEHVGAVRYLGRRVNLIHASRPEWATMNALVQQEDLNLETGATLISVGPPAHLSHQDRAALWQAARAARTKRVEASISAPSPSESETDDDLSAPGNGGVFGGTINPKSEPLPSGGTPMRLWDVRVTNAAAGYVKMACPGQVRKTDDVNDASIVDIADLTSVFSLAPGDYLVLEWTLGGSCTLKQLNDWTDFPWPYATTDDGDFKVFAKAYQPLWAALAPADVPVTYLGRHLPINETLVLERLAPDAHFEIEPYLAKHPSGVLVDVDRFIVGFGAAGPAT